MTIHPVEDILVGMTIAGGPDKVACKVLRVDEGTDQRLGIPLVRLWCKVEGRGEGYVSFGHGGLVEVL